MKKHIHIAKLFTAFVTGLLVMAFAGSSFASSSSDVIPNFTALKIGTTASEPTEGQILTEGKIYSEGQIYAEGRVYAEGNVKSASLLIGTGVKTAALVPTASSISVTGDLDVSGDLTSDAMGSFYVVSDSCEGDCANWYTSDQIWGLSISCESGDIALSCDGFSPLTTDDYEDGLVNYYLVSFLQESAPGSCVTLSDVDNVYANSLCFSPDGEPTAGVESDLSTSLESFFTGETLYSVSPFESSAELVDEIELLQTEIDGLTSTLDSYALDFTDLLSTVDSLETGYTSLIDIVDTIDTWAATNYSATYGSSKVMDIPSWW